MNSLQLALAELKSSGRSLSPTSADLWLFSTAPTSPELENLNPLLSPTETARANRFKFERDRIRFIASHGILRLILSAYTGEPPASLSFASGPQGKPSLHGTNIEFNLSHSGDYAALLITHTSPCGIDIELVRPISEADISRRFFSKSENQWLATTPGAERLTGFFRIWTLKEALIKALGHGMSKPLSSVDVSDILKGASQYASNSGAETSAPVWMLELDLLPGYAAAVAIRGDARPVRFMAQTIEQDKGSV